MLIRSLLILPIALLAACATPARREAAATTPTPQPSAFDRAVTHERILVAGQPTRADLAALRQHGITQVINLRTAEEMAGLGFDESAELAALGVGYSHQPVAGNQGFSPELLAAFEKLVAQSNGKVLLHCASGARASLVYAAYAMKHLGLDPDAAMRTLEPFGGWPLPIERMTGEHLRVIRSSEVGHGAGKSVPNAVDSALGRSTFATCPQ